MNAAIAAIDGCKYLYLASVSEPEDGGLRLVVHEARAGGPVAAETLAAEPLPELRAVLASSSAIEHGPGCKVFDIYWPNYIAYAIENESYALGQPEDSEAEGRLFKLYKKSAYLDYLSRVSFATSDYPGSNKHWAVLCLDHIVNVASTNEPAIRMHEA
ncbi:hypothetical protein [Rhizobacter fulvus]